MHKIIPHQDRYFGSDFYGAVYQNAEQEMLSLKSRPELITKFPEHLVPKQRTLVDFIEDGAGIKVGTKNKSVFREHMKTTRDCTSEYAETISVWKEKLPNWRAVHYAGLETKYD